MNYINQLEENKRLNRLKIELTNDKINEFSKFLQTSDKFKGFDANGYPNDLINIKDVVAWLEQIKKPLNMDDFNELNNYVQNEL